MDAELRQVANGFDYKIRSFDKYDINGYCFGTYGKELSMADRKSTNCCVSAIGEGDIKYYGRVEAIYELQFYGANPPNVVVFKCYWFQPKETRRSHGHLGVVEIKQRTHLDVPDVYIRLNRQHKFSIYHGPIKVIQISVVGMSFMKCLHMLDHLPPMKRIMNLTLTQTHMKQNSSKKHAFPENLSRNVVLHSRTVK